MPSDRYEVKIETIAAGGDGLGRLPEGIVVFVPRAAPGDLLEVEIVETHAQWARARIVRIIEAATVRQEPTCPYYSRCGGCQLQHLTYEDQLRVKSTLAADALRRISGIDIQPPPIEPSPEEFGYRNRVTFTLRRASGGLAAGYHGLERGSIVDIAECPLAEPAINAVWRGLREWWGEGARYLPPGDELRLTLRATSSGSTGLTIQGAKGRGEPELLLEHVPGLEAIWAIGDDGAVDWCAGASQLEDRGGGGGGGGGGGEHTLWLSGNTFVQVNREATQRLEEFVFELCGEVAGKRVLDAYCGFGIRALNLALAGARVTGIDHDTEMIEAARSAAIESSLNVDFIASRVERALADELPADIAILNPPRRGLSHSVIKIIAEAPPQRIIYVSCDPATLARDIKRLADVYKLESIRAFDLFPQTAHVETVVSLEASAG